MDAPTEILQHTFLDEFKEKSGLCGHIMHGLLVHGRHAEVIKVVQRYFALTEVISKASKADFVTQMCG